jgi:hypothetical protein
VVIVNSKAQLAVAVAAGYALGRRQKLRLALALAVAGATGRLGARQRDLLQQGIKVLSSSPELEKITTGVRDGLIEAGKAAAVAAASKQINSLSNRLTERAESLRHPGGFGDGAGSEEAEGGRTVGKTKVRETTDRLRGGERARGAERSSTSREEPQDEEDFSDDELQDEEDFSDEEPQARQRSHSDVRRERVSSSDRPVRRVRR